MDVGRRRWRSWIEAGPLLLADEARNNLVFGIAGPAAREPEPLPGRRDSGSPSTPASRSRPRCGRRRSTSSSPSRATTMRLPALADIIDDEPPGIVGAQPEVDEFTRLWAERHGITPRPLRAQGVYALERVEPVPGAAGAPRDATQADRPLLLEWMVAFGNEVLAEEDPGRTEAVGMVDAPPRLAATAASGSGRTRPPSSRSPARAARPRTASGSVPSIRLPIYAGAATRLRSSPTSRSAYSTAAGASASSSPTSPTRPRTRSTSGSATSGSRSRRWSPMSEARRASGASSPRRCRP